MLDWPGSSGFLCFIIYNLVGLWVYTWKRNEPPWCPVIFVCEMVQKPLCHCGKPVVTIDFYNPGSSEKLLFFFLKSVQPSVSLTTNLLNLFFIQQKVHLYCQVLWTSVFDTFDMNSTATVAMFLNIFSKKKCPYLFIRRAKWATMTHLFFLFCFFYDNNFLSCGILNFGYCQVKYVTLSSRAFWIFVNGVKMHVQHSLKKKKICIFGVWM